MLLSQRTDATALHTAVDMLDPQPTLVQRLVGSVLLQRQLLAAGFLRRHEDLHLRERERQEAQILQQPTPSRERVGGCLSDAQIMDTATVGVAQKEDEEQGIDQQDIFDRVVPFLATITPTGKPPPLAVRLAKALPFRRARLESEESPGHEASPCHKPISGSHAVRTTGAIGMPGEAPSLRGGICRGPSGPFMARLAPSGGLHQTTRSAGGT